VVSANASSATATSTATTEADVTTTTTTTTDGVVNAEVTKKNGDSLMTEEKSEINIVPLHDKAEDEKKSASTTSSSEDKFLDQTLSDLKQVVAPSATITKMARAALVKATKAFTLEVFSRLLKVSRR